MKTKFYIAITILCTSLSGISSAGETVVGMSYTNNTTSPITVNWTTPKNKKSKDLIIAPGATQRTAPLTFSVDTTQITISDSKSPTINFKIGKYWCADLRPESVQAQLRPGIVQIQTMNNFTITNSNNALIVTPAACPSNYTPLVTTPRPILTAPRRN